LGARFYWAGKASQEQNIAGGRDLIFIFPELVAINNMFSVGAENFFITATLQE